MKTLFLGDSHLASLKEADPMPSNKENIFFSRASLADSNMGMLTVHGKRLVPNDDRLKAYFEKLFQKTEIDLSGVNTAVLVGLRMEFPYKLVDVASGYSKQVLRQAMLDLITKQSIAIGLAEKIRQIDQNINIFVIPNPLITTHLKSHKITTAQGIIPVAQFGELSSWPDDLFPLWQSVIEQAFTPIGVHVCFQNPSTIVDGIFTKPEFANDPLNIPPGIRHMNSAFWTLVWAGLDKKRQELSGNLKSQPRL